MFGKGKIDDMKPKLSGATIIAQGTVITGDISCDNDIRIDGELQGNIESQSKVVVGAGGKVRGVIHCKQADIMGSVVGDIYANELLSLRSKAAVTGNISTANLELENAAIFNGRCEMQASASPVDTQNKSNGKIRHTDKKPVAELEEA